MTKPIKIVVIVLLCTTLMSGCLEGTTETSRGTQTHDYISRVTTTDLDYYKNGLHYTGSETQRDGEVIRMSCRVSGNIEGLSVTGTLTQQGGGEPYIDLNVDGSKAGTLWGTNRVTGTMRGTLSNVRVELTEHRTLGDNTDVTYIDMR